MTATTYNERAPRIEGYADRLIEAYRGRAGSEDVGLILDEVQDSSSDLVRDLGELVASLAFKAADALTVYDVMDPQRRLVPEKIDRLRAQMEDATRRWIREVKEVSHG